MMSLIDRGETAPPGNCRRLVLLGSSKVGKTSIVSRFLHDNFDETYSPTIENFYRKIYKIRGQPYRLDILDTAGHHPFPAMTRLSYMTGDLFILTYDITNRNSFLEIQQKLDEILEYRNQATPEADDQLPPASVIVVGNKCDKEKERAVHVSEVRSLLTGDKASFDVIEASAKTRVNIDEIFIRLFRAANLPEEMCPSLHRKVTPSFKTKSRKSWNITRKVSEACGVVQPNVRRPSVGTDLRAARARTNLHGSHSYGRDSKCVVQ